MTTVAPRRGQPTAADQPTRRPMTAIVVAAAWLGLPPEVLKLADKPLPRE